MRTRLPLALAFSALALAACGSTVQVRGNAALGDGLGGTTGASTGSDSVGSTGTTGTTGSVPTATTGGTTGLGGTSTSGTGGSTGGGATGFKPGPIPTTAAKKSPVEIGVVIYPDVGAFAAALGSSANVGDQRAEANDAIDWVNAHGGFAGHKVKPVFYEVALTSSKPYAQSYQEICASFTQDHHVVATIFIGNAENGLPSCLQKGKSLLVAHGHYLHTAEDYRALASLVTPEDAGSDRIARALVDEILGRHLMKAGDTLGVMVMDYNGPQKALNSIIVPAMQAKGIKVLSYTIPYPKSTPDISNSVSAVSSAELAMATRGVKNVTFMCPGCFTFFMQDAESQGYYPRYLISSLDGLLALAGKGHSQSLSSVIALGWSATQDVSTFSHPDVMASNPTYKLCRQVEKRNIVDDPTLYASLALCGATMDLYAAANANPVAQQTFQTLLGGFEKLGSSHAGAANAGTLLGPGRHDGTSRYRTLHYSSGCDCLVYDAAAPKAFS